MQPSHSEVSDTDGRPGDRGTGRLDDLLTPVRDGLEEVARDLGEALTKAGDALKKFRDSDIAELMRCSPVTALSVAAGIGILAGFYLWARRKQHDGAYPRDAAPRTHGQLAKHLRARRRALAQYGEASRSEADAAAPRGRGQPRQAVASAGGSLDRRRTGGPGSRALEHRPGSLDREPGRIHHCRVCPHGRRLPI